MLITGRSATTSAKPYSTLFSYTSIYRPAVAVGLWHGGTGGLGATEMPLRWSSITVMKHVAGNLHHSNESCYRKLTLQ